MQQQDRPTMPDGAEIGRRLAQCRTAIGVSPDCIWRDLGIAPRLLELYESGLYPVLPAHLDAFADAFGVPRSALVGQSGPGSENRA